MTICHANIKPLWLPQHKKHLDKYFLQWFIGFSEGHGNFCYNHISLSYHDSFVFNNLHSRPFFIISHPDPQLLFYIRSNLGFGFVKKYNYRDTIFYRFFVSDFDGLFRLIHIFHGNFILNSSHCRFQSWFILFISYYKSFEHFSLLQHTFTSTSFTHNFSLYPPNLSYLSLDTPWLSGFIDSCGSFSIKQSLYNPSILLRFILSIPHTSADYLFFQQLQFLFKTSSSDIFSDSFSLSHLSKDLSSPSPSLSFTSFPPLHSQPFLSLFDYLRKFPLKSKKNIHFVKFKKLCIRLHDTLPRSTLSKSFQRYQRLKNSF